MEELACGSRVNAHFVDLRRVVTKVLGVSNDYESLTFTCPRMWPLAFWLRGTPIAAPIARYTADAFCTLHFVTGRPFMSMNPGPLTIVSRISARKSSSGGGSGNVVCNQPQYYQPMLTRLISGRLRPEAAKVSYASSSAWRCSGVQNLFHKASSLTKSSLCHTVGPTISLGKAEYGCKRSTDGSCWPEVSTAGVFFDGAAGRGGTERTATGMADCFEGTDRYQKPFMATATLAAEMSVCS